MMKPDITLEAFAWKVSRDAMDHVEECNKRIEEIAKERDGLWARIAELLEAGNRMLGDHNAPTDCYATGPLTGDPYRDLIMCPSCVWEKVAGHNPAESLEAYRRKVLEEVITKADEERKSKARTSLENSDWLLFITLVRRMAGKE